MLEKNFGISEYWSMSNELSSATSPYLLQHMSQPVHWKEWKSATFALARERNCPVFLSIGYSTCHWCHVMAHESFDDPEVGAMMNERFVNVKVDREELPDVDAVFMAYVQAVSGRGGWPMSIWLTPDGEPIFGGTYFPSKQVEGRASFRDVCDEIHRVWLDHEDAVRAKGKDLLGKLQDQANYKDVISESESVLKSFEKLSEDCSQYFDTETAGFGGGPKFPRPALLRALSFAQGCSLLGEGSRDRARMMFLATLDAMAAGGMNDQLGGGFHRYSVDSYWHVPHFEKMLYDQAQLVRVYADAYLLTGDERHKDVAIATMNYALRELRDSEGGFYCGDDADSVDAKTGESKEGVFWLWSSEEVFELLDPLSAQLFSAKYGVQQGGNIRPESDPHGEFGEGNVLFEALTDKDLAMMFSLGVEECVAKLNRAKSLLKATREERPKPHRDDKVLTAWNALTVSSLVYGSRVMDKPAWLDAAKKCITFLKESLWDGEVLYRSWRKGERSIEAFPIDYTLLIEALINLYEASAIESYLHWAVELQEMLTQKFWDEEQGGFLLTASWGGKDLLSLREDYDGAEPSTQSVAAMNLLRLSYLNGEGGYQKIIDRLFEVSSASLQSTPFAVPLMLIAAHAHEFGMAKVEIARTGDYWQQLNSRYLEQLVIAGDLDAPVVCSDNVCFPPFTSVSEWGIWLENYKY